MKLNGNIKKDKDERIFELVIKPIIVASIYLMDKLLSRIYRGTKRQTSFRSMLFYDASQKAVRKHKSHFVKWIFPALIISLLRFIELDNAYYIFWNDTIRIYVKDLKKEKVEL